jgi:glycosyltransferase involved in cell wall biosynthesis
VGSGQTSTQNGETFFDTIPQQDAGSETGRVMATGRGFGTGRDLSPGLISVIITTYQRADALDAVLRSLSRQGDRDFEIVVADDGSGAQTKAVVDRWRLQTDIALHHTWHPDRGFRAALIRNRAILKSSGDYCIFLDGDCIVRDSFVAKHRRLAEPGWYVTGNRLLLSQQLTAKVLGEALEPEAWSFPQWVRARRRGGVNRLAPLIALPLASLRKLPAQSWRGARGCNLAIWRRDLERVDGFDAAYDGWGREDSDLLARLHHAGVRRKLGNFATGVIHLWHPEADRSRFNKNDRLLDDVIARGSIRARSGLSALEAGT